MTTDEVDAERASVRRWDAMSGGCAADWDTCLRLLVACDREMSSDRGASTHRRGAARTTLVDGIHHSNDDDAGNGDDDRKYHRDGIDAACSDGRCRRSKVWEDAFRVALASSIEDALRGDADGAGAMNASRVDGMAMTTIDTARADDNVPTTETISRTCSAANREAVPPPDDRSSATVIPEDGDASSAGAGESKMTITMGRRCDSCGTHSAALFRSMSNHRLVCRSCRRRRRAGG
jgi:hypothetical protein